MARRRRRPPPAGPALFPDPPAPPPRRCPRCGAPEGDTPSTRFCGDCGKCWVCCDWCVLDRLRDVEGD